MGFTASLRRALATGSTSTPDQLINHVVYETAQGKADVCTSGSYIPLGVCVGISDDGMLLIAGPGEKAHVVLDENFEYSDGIEFGASSDGEAKVLSIADGTVTTLTETWAVGYILIPGTTYGYAAKTAECLVMPHRIIVKAS